MDVGEDDQLAHVCDGCTVVALTGGLEPREDALRFRVVSRVGEGGHVEDAPRPLAPAAGVPGALLKRSC